MLLAFRHYYWMIFLLTVGVIFILSRRKRKEEVALLLMILFLPWVNETGYGPVNDEALVHAYAKDDKGNLYDATGKISEDDLDDHADFVNTPDTKKVSIDDFNKLVDDGWLAEYENDDVEMARKYIRYNLDKFI